MKNKNIFIPNLMIFLIILLFSTAAYSAPSLSLIYVIQQGDTLSEIAAEYEVDLNQLKTENNISNEASIRMGDELVIPQNNKENRETEKKGKKKLFTEYKAQKNKLTFAINTHYAARINPGQQAPDIDKIPEDKIIDYYVGPGDTLYDLARDFSTSIGTILALNDKENSFLRTGEKIRLPIHNLTSHQILNQRVSKQELDLLARAIYGESRGEPYVGQVAVAAVIINRVLSRQFPDTFAQVIYQSGQFSAVSDGQINLTPNQTAYRAAREALNGSDPTNGALYFYNPRTATRVSFFRGRRVITEIGDHVFVE
ncbi:N-acetylmuramoyl-L-alanine amidase [Halanaerobium saccharolyticum]|uniref:N-acetylmuramoyl-L-alanine amidase n=1 Tax=Halanaerobium saccharolyticum TaxID=43595 RepID=A0A4R7Z8D3_9FIRM|nr:cell wall hydrolase [Halanaerobium saccharolyticum]RAK11139.1 N-acetylmuramoyl-L-alanine amidase [Halanaerobium saccharolyticum]TDW06990.1 N-acetylmuramoyl-L-alanine amidase [Halanaerobium saccharolyticum]TDX63755.1 N-acetylmuramoyl-L-alanine amidase [Halanaerobium saccharolyticum]